MKKRITTTLAAAAIGLFFSTGAQASCFASNQMVERVLSYATYGYIYFRPESSLTNSTYYYMRTTSQQILALAAAAQASRSKVNGLGNASSCPSTGTARYMGEATYLYVLN